MLTMMRLFRIVLCWSSAYVKRKHGLGASSTEHVMCSYPVVCLKLLNELQALGRPIG